MSKYEDLSSARVLTELEMQEFRGGAKPCKEGCKDGCKTGCKESCRPGEIYGSAEKLFVYKNNQ